MLRLLFRLWPKEVFLNPTKCYNLYKRGAHSIKYVCKKRMVVVNRPLTHATHIWHVDSQSNFSLLSIRFTFRKIKCFDVRIHFSPSLWIYWLHEIITSSLILIKSQSAMGNFTPDNSSNLEETLASIIFNKTIVETVMWSDSPQTWHSTIKNQQLAPWLYLHSHYQSNHIGLVYNIIIRADTFVTNRSLNMPQQLNYFAHKRL